jgi:hypothetical protein
LNGYLPVIGELISVMSFGSKTGVFSVLNDLDPGDGVTFDVQYDPTVIKLRAISE